MNDFKQYKSPDKNELIGANLEEEIALANEVAVEMMSKDTASKSLEMSIQKMAKGFAQLNMTVRPDMLNGHQICHGGFIFALADSAFAFACNSYNLKTVSSSASIEYLVPSVVNDVLSATAVEISRGRKNGVYDVTVHNQDGVLVALFRGKSYQVQGTVLSNSTH